MSVETTAPVTESATPAPATAAANPSPAPAEGAAPAADAAEEFLADAPNSKAEPSTDGKADDAKPEEAKADPDFLAETDDDDAEGKGDGQADPKQESEPEAYQPFTLPEGLEIDQTVLAEATPILRKAGVNQEGAQELVSFYAAKTQEALTAYHQKLAEGHQETLRTWSNELRELPEYKGKDAFNQAKGRVAHVLNTLGTPELKTLLDRDFGLIRNKALFTFLDTVASKLSEDSLVRDDAGAPVKEPPKRAADVMYS